MQTATVHRCRILMIAVCMFALSAVFDVQARDRGWLYMVADVSLDEAVADVKRTTGSRVLSADTVRQNGREVHRIRVLNDKGRVRQMRIDGKDGREIRRRR